MLRDVFKRISEILNLFFQPLYIILKATVFCISTTVY